MARLRTVLYCRTSTDRQRETQTIASQRDALRRLLDARPDLVFTHEYADDGLSGVLLDERPAFKTLLADAARGKFDAVATCELSRLSRPAELDDLAAIKRVFKVAGVVVVTPDRTYDFRNDSDDFFTDLLGAIAKMERRQIAARTARGKRRVARQAQNAGGSPPYGYNWNRNTKKFEVNPEEAPVVRRIFDMAATVGCWQVVDVLQAEGIPTRRGGRWQKSRIRQILKNPIYMGKYAFNRFKWNPDKKSHRELPPEQWEWAEVPVTAIVSEQVWHRAQDATKERRVFSKRNAKVFYLLGGLIKCTCCGYVMTGEICRNTRYYRPNQDVRRRIGRRCENHWYRADELEAKVWEVVEPVVLDPDRLMGFLAEGQAKEDTKAWIQVASLEKKLTENHRAQENARLQLVKGRLSEVEYDEVMNRLRAERVTIENTLTLERDRAGAAERRERHAQAIADRLRGYRAMDLGPEAMREILRLLCGDTKEAGIWVSPEGKIAVRGLLSPGRAANFAGAPADLRDANVRTIRCPEGCS